jgi:hypothetical protein
MYTLLFLAWGTILILIAIMDLLKGRALANVAAIGCMGLIGVALAFGVWTFMGKFQEKQIPETTKAEQSATGLSPADSTRLAHPLLDSRTRSIALMNRMAIQLLIALGVWFVVVLLVSLAGSVFLHDKTYALSAGLLRFGRLFMPCILIVLAADLILWLAHFRWVGDEPGPEWFSRVAAIGFAALPVIVGLLGTTSLFNQRDPWEYLPGGPPFALRKFAARYPKLHIETVGALGGDVVAVTYGSSPRVIFSESDLRESELIWEKSNDADEPVQLGGPPPYPNSRCLARIQLRKPDYDAMSDEDWDRDVAVPDLRTVRYVYSVGWEYTSKVKEHFLNWARSVGPEPNVYGYQQYWMEVTAGGRKWTIQIQGQKNTVDDVYVEYTERRRFDLSARRGAGEPGGGQMG